MVRISSFVQSPRHPCYQRRNVVSDFKSFPLQVYKLTVLKNICLKEHQNYPDWVNLRTWFLFLYQNVQQEKTEKIKAESGQMTEWKALEPENDSIWRTAIAPWFSSLESSIQHRLKNNLVQKIIDRRSFEVKIPLITYGELFYWIHFLAMVDHSLTINLCFTVRFKVCIKRFLNGAVHLLRA